MNTTVEEFLSLLNEELMGGAFARAKAAGEKSAMKREAALYFRLKPDWGLDLFAPSKNYDRASADDAVRGVITSVSIPWAFEGGKVDAITLKKQITEMAAK